MKVINENKLTQVLDFIKKFQVDEGRSPSFRQIAKAVSFPSIATSQKYVSILQARGLIERNDFGRIITPTQLEAGPTIVAPMIGEVACGTPILAVENIENSYPLPSAIFGTGATFLLKAKGDSMINAGINSGDILVVKKCETAENGDIVIALINDEATAKTFYKTKENVILHPENPKYNDIILNKDFRIIGKVVSSIHKFN